MAKIDYFNSCFIYDLILIKLADNLFHHKILVLFLNWPYPISGSRVMAPFTYYLISTKLAHNLYYHNILLLAHQSRSDRVSFCDQSMSVVRVSVRQHLLL